MHGPVGKNEYEAFIAEKSDSCAKAARQVCGLKIPIWNLKI
jgi:hypothetical protein